MASSQHKAAPTGLVFPLAINAAPPENAVSRSDHQTKKRARKGPVEVTEQRPQALSTLRGAMKYIHTSARKYMAGIIVNNTA